MLCQKFNHVFLHSIQLEQLKVHILDPIPKVNVPFPKYEIGANNRKWLLDDVIIVDDGSLFH